jgi:hypothetical protein
MKFWEELITFFPVMQSELHRKRKRYGIDRQIHRHTDSKVISSASYAYSIIK